MNIFMRMPTVDQSTNRHYYLEKHENLQTKVLIAQSRVQM